MSQIDIANAKSALATRLRMWGAAGDVNKLASGFIEDLIRQGWEMSAHRETRLRPPKAADQCPRHPGQWATSCGGCEADTRADDEPATPPRAWNAGDPRTGIAACRAALAGAKTEGEDA